MGTDLPVELLLLKLWKVDGKLRAVEKFLVDEEKFFLDALGLELFPWPFLGLVFMCREVSGALLHSWLLRWALHSRT